MALFTAFGINGVGKDTVLGEIKKIEPDIRLISETKLLMYGFNILRAYDESVTPSRDDYVALEAVPQAEIKIIEQSFPEILRAETRDRPITIITSHLIPAQLLQREAVYLVKPKPACLHELSKALIQYTADPETVLQRRSLGSRDRGNLGMDDIIHHQNLCDGEWLRLQKEAEAAHSPAQFVTIVNEDLEEATANTLKVIYGEA